MTSLGASYIRRGALASLQSPPSRVIARRAQARRGNLRKAATNLPGAFPCSGRYREIATAPAEPRNDKLGGLLHPEGRSDKLASAFLPCHCGARSALGSPFGRAVTEGD